MGRSEGEDAVSNGVVDKDLPFRESAEKHPVHRQPSTFGQRMADKTSLVVGSWRFLIIQSILIILWIVTAELRINHLDNQYLTILNLLLSIQAAFATPIILVSQNRWQQIDRQRAEHDYLVNQEALSRILHIEESVLPSVLQSVPHNVQQNINNKFWETW